MLSSWSYSLNKIWCIKQYAYEELKKERDRSWVLQFLIKLRLEFKNARANIINKRIEDINVILFYLIWEETRLNTQVMLDNKNNLVAIIFLHKKLMEHATSSLIQDLSLTNYSYKGPLSNFSLEKNNVSKPISLPPPWHTGCSNFGKTYKC